MHGSEGGEAQANEPSLPLFIDRPPGRTSQDFPNIDRFWHTQKDRRTSWLGCPSKRFLGHMKIACSEALGAGHG